MGRQPSPPTAILVRGIRDPIFITRPEAHVSKLVAQGWRLLIQDSDMQPPQASPQADGDSGESQLD